MKLEGDFVFEAPIDEVYGALLDPVVLAAAMPGCEKLDRVDGQYQGELNIKVGPIQGKFSGKVDLKDMDPPRGYTMAIDGRGAPGFVKAVATVRLEPEGETTRMRYEADAQVGGKIASVGQRLLEASARAISKQSLEGLHENVKIRAAAAKAAKAPAAAPPTDAPAKAPATSPVHDVGDVGVTPPEPPRPLPAPVVLKQVDQTALAASIAKEVTKSLLPRPALIAFAIGILAVLGWLVARR